MQHDPEGHREIAFDEISDEEAVSVIDIVKAIYELQIKNILSLNYVGSAKTVERAQPSATA